MRTTNNGGPAFPSTSIDEYGCHRVPSNSGMTLRDWFAGMALQGTLASYDAIRCPEERLKDIESWRSELRAADVKFCYQIADAMLERREQL